MSAAQYDNLGQVIATDESKEIPAGSQSISLANIGNADGSFTQNGLVFTLPAGSVFNFPVLSGARAWNSVSVNASGTKIECAYY